MKKNKGFYDKIKINTTKKKNNNLFNIHLNIIK